MENNRAWELLGKKLTGEASPAELAELDRLARGNPAIQYALEVMAALWKERKKGITDEEITGYYARHLDRMKALGEEWPEPPLPVNEPVLELSPEEEMQGYPLPEPAGGSSVSRRAFRMAAVVAAILVVSGGIYRLLPKRSPGTPTARLSEVSTKNGSRSKVLLPDGSQVWLNAGSRLTYANDLTSAPTREVTLSGEAFFEVVHDDAHPFIIHTRTLDIRDIGTRFNVKSYPDDPTTEATLIQGAIEISFRKTPGEKIILKPNQKIVLFNNEPSAVSVNNSRKAANVANPADDIYKISRITPDPRENMITDTAWMANKLIFRSEDFASLALQLERWYNVKIRFHSDVVEQVKFTGVLENETITQALEALQITGAFKYKIDGDTVNVWK